MTSKSSPLLFVSIFSLLLSFCKKDQKTIDASADFPVAKARSYFNSAILTSPKATNRNNYRANQARAIRWDLARTMQLSTGQAVIAPVSYEKKMYTSTTLSGNNVFELSDVTNLVLFRDSTNAFHCGLVTFLPDSIAIKNNAWNSGIVLIEDWQGNTLTKPQRFQAKKRATTGNATKPENIETDLYQSIQVCNEIDGYNYSPDDPSGGFAWSETTCTTYGLLSYNADNGGGSGVGPGDIYSIYGLLPIPIPTFTIEQAPPGNPIGNITDYLKCFTPSDNSGYNFIVTLAVEQPVQGTRTPWTFTRGGISGSSAAGNPFNVGHTWLIFTESTPNGTTTRNVGFYPQSLVSPFSPSAQGVLNDDEATVYNICLSVSINSSQFFSMLNYISQGNNAGYMYNLNSNNCTGFALEAMAAGNVPIPTTIGTWVGNGKGVDPGDLGEDIRNMPLPIGMTRNTVSNYHPNTGNCN